MIVLIDLVLWYIPGWAQWKLFPGILNKLSKSISYGACVGPAGHVRELTQPELAKIPPGRGIWLYGPLTVPAWAVHGCLWSLNPYGACKLIMHALKLYRSCTGKQNLYGTARGLYGPHEWTYDFCSKQPGNSLYGARECDVTGVLPDVFTMTVPTMIYSVFLWLSDCGQICFVYYSSLALKWEYHPTEHDLDYYPGAASLSQVCNLIEVQVPVYFIWR